MLRCKDPGTLNFIKHNKQKSYVIMHRPVGLNEVKLHQNKLWKSSWSLYIQNEKLPEQTLYLFMQVVSRDQTQGSRFTSVGEGGLFLNISPQLHLCFTIN